jgi:hypothetical protein
VAYIGKTRNAYKVFIGKPLGRCRRRWDSSVRMCFKEVQWEGVNWAVINMVMNFHVP